MLVNRRYQFSNIPYVFGTQCSVVLDWNAEGEGPLVVAGGPDELGHLQWREAIKRWQWYAVSRGTSATRRMAKILTSRMADGWEIEPPQPWTTFRTSRRGVYLIELSKQPHVVASAKPSVTARLNDDSVVHELRVLAEFVSRYS
jgi:hypothetical protein